MNMLSLVSEMNLNNDFYDVNKQNNGGGYYQPCYIYSGTYENKPIEVQIRDTSCGEFGSTPQYRVYVMNEITNLYESTLMKADKYKWLPFLEHELYICYQNLITNNLNL